MKKIFVNILCSTAITLLILAILEFMLDIGYMEVAVIIFGAIFNWYCSTPIWVLAVMTTIIYIAGVFLNMVQMRQEVEEINELLQKRK